MDNPVKNGERYCEYTTFYLTLPGSELWAGCMEPPLKDFFINILAYGQSFAVLQIIDDVPKVFDQRCMHGAYCDSNFSAAATSLQKIGGVRLLASNAKVVTDCLSEARLNEACLSEARLRRASVRQDSMRRASVRQELSEACLSETCLTKASFVTNYFLSDGENISDFRVKNSKFAPID